jgi:hypothetical protein
MKNTYKFLLIIFPAILFFACSKDKETEPKFEDHTFIFSFKDPGFMLQAPSGLRNSNDEMAQSVVELIEDANSITDFFDMMEIPAGAEKSHTPIIIGGGNPSPNTKYWVYKWSDDGSPVAYQVSESSSKYTWEFLYKGSGEEWFRMVYAEEKKDRSTGKMDFYNFFFGAPDQILFNYEWNRSANLFELKITGQDLHYHFTMNSSTKAGKITMKFEDEEVINFEVIWDAQGNGSWRYYYEDGEVIEEGSWTV